MKKFVSTFIVFMLVMGSIMPAFASANDYTIISPRVSTAGVTYCDNLLVSIKVAQGKTLRISLYNYPKFGADGNLNTITTDTFSEKVLVGAASDFRSGNQVNFYTNQVNSISPGLYSIKVDILNSSGAVISSENNYFIVKGKQAAPSTDLFEAQPSSTMQFFQGLFKNLFGVV